MTFKLALVALALALAACGGTDSADEASESTEATLTTEGEVTTTSAEPVSEDPYDVFLANGGGDLWVQEIGEPVISREDAQTRALLGCDTEWAPGTIDALLVEAYC